MSLCWSGSGAQDDRQHEARVAFDRERPDAVKKVLGDMRLTSITVNMDVGVLRQVLKRFKQWRRLEDDVKMLTEAGGEPIGRVLSNEEQERLFKTAAANPEWEHVYCAAILAANTSSVESR